MSPSAYFLHWRNIQIVVPECSRVLNLGTLSSALSTQGHYKTWTLDSGLDHGLDSGLNNGLARFLIVRGQRLLSGKVMMFLVL